MSHSKGENDIVSESLHPFVVHFPIALLLMHGVFSALALRYQSAALETSAYHCLIAGWFGSLAALGSGALAALPFFSGGGGQLQLVNAHALLGIAATVVYGQVLLRRRRQPGILHDRQARRGYVLLSIVGAGLILVGGWLGAYLSDLTGAGG